MKLFAEDEMQSNLDAPPIYGEDDMGIRSLKLEVCWDGGSNVDAFSLNYSFNDSDFERKPCGLSKEATRQQVLDVVSHFLDRICE
jgi:hypothetical protein